MVPELPSCTDTSLIEIVGGGKDSAVTVTVPVACAAAPFGSVTVSTTLVWPIGYGPGGDCVIVRTSPASGSNEPLLIDAAAVPVASACTVTLRAMATGTLFGGAHAPMHAPATFSVYCVPTPPLPLTSWTSTANVCAPLARSNAYDVEAPLTPGSPL